MKAEVAFAISVVASLGLTGCKPIRAGVGPQMIARSGLSIGGAVYLPMNIMVTNKGRVFASWRPDQMGNAFFSVLMGTVNKVGGFQRHRNTIIEFVQTNGSAGVLSVIPNNDDSWLHVRMRMCSEDFKKPEPGSTLPSTDF